MSRPSRNARGTVLDPNLDNRAGHKCSVTFCTHYTLPGFVACRRHYMRLPRRVRSQLADIFRQREQHPDVYEQAVELTRRLVQEAADGEAVTRLYSSARCAPKMRTDR